MAVAARERDTLDAHRAVAREGRRGGGVQHLGGAAAGGRVVLLEEDRVLPIRLEHTDDTLLEVAYLSMGMDMAWARVEVLSMGMGMVWARVEVLSMGMGMVWARVDRQV